MKGCVRSSLSIALVLVFSVASAVLAQTPKPGGTLKVAWEADVTGLDPYLSPGVQAWHTVGNLFSSLVTIDANFNYVPELAESWDIQENGKVYVFRLRKGVKFHEGSDFDAEVVECPGLAVAFDEDELERRLGDGEVGVAGTHLGGLGVEELGVELDGLLEVGDVEGQLDS